MFYSTLYTLFYKKIMKILDYKFLNFYRLVDSVVPDPAGTSQQQKKSTGGKRKAVIHIGGNAKVDFGFFGGRGEKAGAC